MNKVNIEKYILEKIRESNEQVGINNSSTFLYLQKTIPKKYEGIGTGNLQAYIFLLRDKGYIELTDNEISSSGEIKGIIRLKADGYKVFDSFWKKHWQIIIAILVSISTMATSIFTILQYFKK